MTTFLTDLKCPRCGKRYDADRPQNPCTADPRCSPGFDVPTLKKPYRLEGKKTMGYEIVEQLGWRVPDVILYPHRRPRTTRLRLAGRGRGGGGTEHRHRPQVPG